MDFFIAFCFSTARLFLIHAPTANAETTLRNGLAGSINNGTEKNIPGQCQNVIAVFLQRNLKFAHRVRRYLHRRCQRHRNHFANHNDTGAFILGGVKAGRVISVRAAVVWFGRHARSDTPDQPHACQRGCAWPYFPNRFVAAKNRRRKSPPAAMMIQLCLRDGADGKTPSGSPG
jgi:hypothetical protein